MADPYGLSVVYSDLVEPGTVYVWGGSASFLPLDPPVLFKNVRTWREEIRQIVRDGIAQAHPWLVLPRQRLDPDPVYSILADQRLAMQMINPRSVVTITDVG